MTGHLMADGIRECGKADDHTGKHYSVATVQREIERCRRRRQNPGPCTRKDCTSDRQRFMTGSYDVYCYRHRDLAQSKQAVLAARRRRDRLYEEYGITRDHIARSARSLTPDQQALAAIVVNAFCAGAGHLAQTS